MSNLVCTGCGGEWDDDHEAGKCPVPDLKPCPHCGNADPTNESYGTETLDGRAVCCDPCGVRGPIKPTALESVEAWNAMGRVG